MIPVSQIISVVIAAYNAERWIEETLDSVLAQTYKKIEVIVVDDGSTDGTAEIITRYAEKVRYLYQPNSGQPSARNVGIRAARGPLLAFVDADDVWLPNKLELQTEFLANNDSLAWVYSDVFYYDMASGSNRETASQTIKMFDGDILEPLLMGNFIPSPTPMIKKEVFDVVGYFDESPSLRIGEDWNMWLKIAAVYNIGYIPKPLAIVRCHPTSMIGSINLSVSLQSKLQIIEQATRRETIRLKNTRKRALARVYIDTALYMLARDVNHREPRKLFYQALRLEPRSTMALGGVFITFCPQLIINRIKILRRYIQRTYCHLKHAAHNQYNRVYMR